MIPTIAQLTKIAGKSDSKGNLKSLVEGLRVMGPEAGLVMPHRLAHYIPQMMHESGGGQWDGELWGPTPAQERYDGRTDLGNTAALDGDGKLYRGRTMLQITGKANYAAFRDWCRAKGLAAPDFVANPDAVNTDPWEGISPIWYWTTRKLNALADENNIEAITKRVNGGLNGYQDRLRYYTRTALVFLGFEPTDVKGFQKWAQQRGYLPADEPGKPPQVDGDFGIKSRSAAHMALVELGKPMASVADMEGVKAAPVTEEVAVEVAVPVTKGAEKTGVQRILAGFGAGSPLLAMLGGLNGLDRGVMFTLVGIGVVGTIAMLVRGEWIAARLRSVLGAFGGEEKP